MKKLELYIKKCRKTGFKDEAIKKYLQENNVPTNLVDESFKKLELNKNILLGSAFTVLLLMIGIFAFNPSFIGLVTQQNIESYNDSVNINLSHTSEIEWTPANNGELISLLMSGKIIGNGSARIYLKTNKTQYLILDTSTLKDKLGNQLTGLVIGDTTQIENDTQPTETITPVDNLTTTTLNESDTLEINTTASNNTNNESIILNVTQIINDTTPEENLTINLNQTNDNNTFYENDTSIIDNTSLISDVSESYTTLPIIINETKIIENIPTDNNTTINETLTNNTTEENIINETFTTPLDKLNQTTDEIILPSDELEFNNACQDTCMLLGLQRDSYSIGIIIDGDAELIINTLSYSIKTLQEKENLTTNLTINQTLINETINVTINETIINATSNVTIINETLIETNATINGIVEIGKPVLWKQTVNLSEVYKITLPQETFNITLKDDNTKIKIKGQELTINEYNLEKQKDIYKKDLEKIKTKQEKNNKKKQEEIKKTKGKASTSEIDKKIQTINQEINTLTTRIVNLEKITRNITIDQNITLTFNNSLLINNSTNTSNNSNIVELEYFTEGPTSTEDEKNNYNKLVTVSSNIHYTDIKAYTDVTETKQEMISLYWQTLDGKIKVNDINYVDTNNNGLIDRIEWTVPHLSNQTYEVNISILNLHSYPMVGGQWVVEFVTTGVSNLTISAVNGTIYGQDISPYSLRCDDTPLTYSFDGLNLFYTNYECNGTGYFSATELKQGAHTQKFTFGDATAYAYNFAGNLPKTINLHGKLTNSTSGLINTTTNFTFSIYSTPLEGVALWSENQTNVNVSEGIYSVLLGSVTPITLNFSEPYWLGIIVNNDSEMSPRINLTNTPYSYNSFYAQEALDLLCTDCIGNVEINTTGTFNIDGNLNAANNITLGDSIVDAGNKKRFTITQSSVIIDLN